MGSKISKYSNLYSADGELLRKVDEETGVLKNYTTGELEQLLDKLSEDKDENGNVKDPRTLNNVYYMLMQYYMKCGNPLQRYKYLHEKEIKQKLEEMAKQRGIEEQVESAMNELKEAVIEEPKVYTQEDLLVEREHKTPIVMEEVIKKDDDEQEGNTNSSNA